ncbi:FAD-dependent oxidoreductase [Meridianimarinicoccus sp. MJW13]|uniref:FAD-dependent oxidoreductase n=1 Tax=Meridianimarinicoccus sp. MJW13 TaxID=2720031 RepID=UPI001867BEC5|nr:GMC family oxidoreductase [Fluviibacterium sp. MJW13]
MTAPEVIVIGSGMGGASLAASLAPSGRRILILERGEHLRPCAEDRDAGVIFGTDHFRSGEGWQDALGRDFCPGNYYMVGGNSKFFGGAMYRFRTQDFAPLTHLGGTTPGWPIGYDTLVPYYDQAEALFQVRGAAGNDPTEPPRNRPYPHPPVPDEPVIADLRRRLTALGLHPSAIPLAVDIDRWLAGGQTPWDGFPETRGGKLDAETAALARALSHDNVTLRTGCRVRRLLAGAGGGITGIEVDTPGGGETLTAPVIVLAAGAVQSAALLLGSADADRPAGLANRSDQVGRNFMNHNCSAVLALHPLRKNPSVYQKTLALNDFYLTGGAGGTPLGNVQLLGKISGRILTATTSLPRPLAHWIAARSVDFYAMSEDLPNPDSRVTLRDGQVVLDWKRSNWPAHEALVARLKTLLRKAGFPVILSRAFDRRTPSHQCGTARMGADPRASVVDPFGRSHDHPNLFIADASVLPTSAAVNPALTISALAMRTADHIRDTDLAI